MSGKPFSRLVETRESVDYAYVINLQLDRIANMRSRIFQEPEKVPFKSLGVWGFLMYLSHVESLYAMLLPELRGDSGKYLKIAKTLYWYETDIDRLEKKLKDLEQYSWTKREEKEAVKAEIERLRKEKIRILNELPEDVRENVRTIKYLWIHFVYVIDKALEEMLKKLNEAGLLLHGKSVKIGVVRGSR
ncbi:MAG: hypothetical protein DRN04_18660 [Thermoprotei archaeon]|nr:MAG: hypothetical protein DRN04_18660 [Thermoprotei archaeon]